MGRRVRARHRARSAPERRGGISHRLSLRRCVFFEITSLYPLFPGTNELDQINRIHKV